MATNKTRSNNTNKKGRDKNINAFDDNKINKSNTKAEAIEEVIDTLCHTARSFFLGK